MTLIDLITAQSARLKSAGVSFGHGTGNAFDEAAWLVLWALGLPLDALEAKARSRTRRGRRRQGGRPRRPPHRDPPAGGLPDPRGLAAERAVLHRRTQHRAALLHRRAAGRRRRQRHAGRVAQRHGPSNVLDLCTGNGSLAVIAAMAYPEVNGRCRGHLRRGPGSRAHQRRPSRAGASGSSCCKSDLLAGRARPLRLDPLQPALRQHREACRPCRAEYQAEPALALAGGADGMDLVRRILREAPEAPDRRRGAGPGDRPRAPPFRTRLPAPGGGLARDQRRRGPGLARDPRGPRPSTAGLERPSPCLATARLPLPLAGEGLG